MTDFNLILSQVRQRLEILYQIVDRLEAEGGGGGGDTGDYEDLSNKPKINSVTLSGNKSSSDLGLAAASDLEAKANAADVYTKSETYNKTEVYTKAETTAEIGSAITDLDVPSTTASGYYVKSIAQEDGLIVPVTDTVQDYLSPSSTHPVTSGAVYSANQTLDGKITKNTSALVEVIDNGAKNIANWTASTSTINNVKFTVSGDTITVTLTSGTTATARSQKGLSVTFRSDLPSGTYVLSGAPALTAGGLYLWDQTTSSRVTPISDMGSGTVFTFNYDSTHTYNITVDIANGYTIPTGTSLVFKPMICSKVQWDISQTYEPYSMTYPELTESKIGSLDVFGVGTAITENTDLNNLRTPGAYYCINATIAATLIHSPVSQSFRLLVTNTNTNARYDQIIFARDAASIYRRSDTGGGFGNWYLFSGTEIVPAQAQFLSPSFSQLNLGLEENDLTVEPNDEEMR